MKAVIYARYSSDNQREESIEGQIRECTAFAEKNGMTILRHYIDRAYSAKTDRCFACLQLSHKDMDSFEGNESHRRGYRRMEDSIPRNVGDMAQNILEYKIHQKQ